MVALISAFLFSLVIVGAQILEKSLILSARSLTKNSPIQGMSNLVVWYESTMAQSFEDENITSGSAVGVWRNINPSDINQNITIVNDVVTVNDNNAAVAGGTISPTYESSTINRLPAVSFHSDSSQFFTFDGTGISNSDYTVIVVEQRRKATLNYFITGSSSTEDQSLLLGYEDESTIYFGQEGNIVATAIESFFANNNIPRIHIFRFNSSLTSTTCKNYFCYQKDVGACGGSNPQTLADVGSADQCQGLISNIGAQIGKNSGSNYYGGDIGEIIIFNKYINDDERRSVELYLSKKWGIVLN